MKIAITRREKIEEAVKKAEGRASVRTVTYDMICRVLDEVSEDIPKTKLHGTKVHYDGAKNFPKAYKYTPESTHWIAENFRGKWYLIDVYRDTCPNRMRNTQVMYSDSAKQAIVDSRSHCIY